ncbi:MAG: cytidine deaminase [Polyangiaceae bacterium]|nr:cytidine deaminase [Polyangiaceae bacterium]
MNEDDWEALRIRATEVRERAHAPYSHYRVGAALIDARGRIYAGANVENASYGLCICAERSAISAAVADGARHFVGIVVMTEGASPATPCGACRQVLREFPPSFPVRCLTTSGARIDSTVEALLPHGFGPELLP